MDKKTAFIKKIAPAAEEIRACYAIHPRVLVAQAAHESGWGASGLAAKYNNLFGFVSSESWELAGRPFIDLETREHSSLPPEKIKHWRYPGDIKEKKPAKDGGTDLIVVRGFRVYGDWLESCLDWAERISKGDKFKDAYEWAKKGAIVLFGQEMQKAGYATDPNYAKKLERFADDPLISNIV